MRTEPDPSPMRIKYRLTPEYKGNRGNQRARETAVPFRLMASHLRCFGGENIFDPERVTLPLSQRSARRMLRLTGLRIGETKVSGPHQETGGVHATSQFFQVRGEAVGISVGVGNGVWCISARPAGARRRGASPAGRRRRSSRIQRAPSLQGGVGTSAEPDGTGADRSRKYRRLESRTERIWGCRKGISNLRHTWK